MSTSAPPPALRAAEVARQAKSNLAFALACLPRERRRDMVTFYAFCRIVDDIADENQLSLKDRRIQLGAWRRIVRGEQEPADEIARDLVVLPQRHHFPAEWLEEVIEGVSMDLEKRRYADFEELRAYCYKVASVVGLVSLPIFGVPVEVGREYAINLGLALQLTNILRDIRVDWENGQRVYLPQEELAAYGVTEDMIDKRQTTLEFLKLMQFQAARAEAFYQAALAARPKEWVGRLQAAEAMRHIYHGLLQQMRARNFPVLHTRCRLSMARKLVILARAWLRSRLATIS